MKSKLLDIFTLEEVAIQQQSESLKIAMGILLKLEAELCQINIEPIKSFKYIRHEVGRGYVPFNVLFEQRYKEANISNSHLVFARSEIERITGLLKQVKQLSDSSYYSQHPIKIRAEEYIEYLNEFISNGSQPMLSVPSKSKGRPSAKCETYNLRNYIKGDIDTYNMVLKALKKRLAIGGIVELAKAVLVLQTKNYYIRAITRRELYEALAKELGDIGSYNNWGKRLRAYDNALTESEITTINNLLP